MSFLRLRQLVFVSNNEADIARLQNILGLGAPFVDPGVSVFGLTNGVFALGDQFLEVVVPVEEKTAAGRFLDRTGGQGGYMAIFQTEDLEAVRLRADKMQIRRVWNIDVDDISASHMHPTDIGAAIVSVDKARPAGAWRWGGPDWPENAVPGKIVGLNVVAPNPKTLASRWGQLLAGKHNTASNELPIQDGQVRFIEGDRDFLDEYVLFKSDWKACLDRARAEGLPIFENGFLFAGVKVSFSPN